MAHQLTINRKTGTSTFARREGTEKAWHEHANFRAGIFTDGMPLDEMMRTAGFDFEIVQIPLTGTFPDGEALDADTHLALARQDFDGTERRHMTIMSKTFKVHQPQQIFEFMHDVATKHNLDIDTAGVMFDGLKYWCMATDGMNVVLPGNDRVKRMFLIATSIDGSLATHASQVSTRVVCNNTLSVALSRTKGVSRQTHRSEFDPTKAELDLGLVEATESWCEFSDQVKELTRVRPTQKQALDYLLQIYGEPDKKLEEQAKAAVRKISDTMELYEGKGMGATLASSEGTAWGLLNAVTEYTDHHTRARSSENRQTSAWWGPGSASKRAAYELACTLGRSNEWLAATERFEEQKRAAQVQALPDMPPPGVMSGEDLFASLLMR